MYSDFSGQALSLIDYLLQCPLLIPILSNLFCIWGTELG